MENKDVTLLDKVFLQKYVYLLDLLVSGEIETSLSELTFLEVRRRDSYWGSGELNEKASKILDTFFLDVDEYAPDEWYDPEDRFNINETEFKRRAENTLSNLRSLPEIDH